MGQLFDTFWIRGKWVFKWAMQKGLGWGILLLFPWRGRLTLGLLCSEFVLRRTSACVKGCLNCDEEISFARLWLLLIKIQSCNKPTQTVWLLDKSEWNSNPNKVFGMKYECERSSIRKHKNTRMDNIRWYQERRKEVQNRYIIWKETTILPAGDL